MSPLPPLLLFLLGSAVRQDPSPETQQQQMHSSNTATPALGWHWNAGSSSCTFARSPLSGICRHQASRDGVASEHPRATHPCFLRMLSYMRVHWPSTGSLLVPRGFPSPGACQRTRDGSLGLSFSPSRGFSGRFPGCVNTPTAPANALPA